MQGAGVPGHHLSAEEGGKPRGVASMNSGNRTAGPQDSSQDVPASPSRRGSSRADPQHPARFPQHVPASSALTEKINIRVLDPFTIKPLDRKLILDSARATKGRILTVEDHYYEGEGLAREPGPLGQGGPGTGWTPLLYPSPGRTAVAQDAQSCPRSSWDWAPRPPAGPGDPANSQLLESPRGGPATQEAGGESHLPAKSGEKVACVPEVVMQNQTGRATHNFCRMSPYRAVLHNPHHLLRTGEEMGLDSGDRADASPLVAAAQMMLLK